MNSGLIFRLAEFFAEAYHLQDSSSGLNLFF